MKKLIAVVLIIILAALGWHYRFVLQKFSQHLPDLAQSPLINEIKQEISTPPPLIGNLTGQKSYLTAAGAIKWTNVNRAENSNLPALKENAKLDQAAQLKLQDMFKQQYFEHVNPQGVGPADLATKVGYNFLTEGENLALGNFADDKALVTAWMNSPGHRANILNIKYTEIGVAVGEGMYQGHDTWLAVQEFGRPASDCPTVSSSLKTQIDGLKSQTQTMEQDLTTQKNYLDSTTPTNKQQASDYNSRVISYNSEVNTYNNLINQLKNLIAQYNGQVDLYNACLGS